MRSVSLRRGGGYLKGEFGVNGVADAGVVDWEREAEVWGGY